MPEKYTNHFSFYGHVSLNVTILGPFYSDLADQHLLTFGNKLFMDSKVFRLFNRMLVF